MNNKFQSLDEYKYELDQSNSLFEAGEEKGMFGNIIDKAASFVPRAIRFKKARTNMTNALNGYLRKSTKVINSFSKEFAKKIDVIEEQYNKLKSEKIEPLVADNKQKQAGKYMQVFLKELEQYRETQISNLDKALESIYGSYNSAIEKRIDTPGFILNVELSEKGKGELKAKWQELSAIAKMKIQSKKEQIINNEGWEKLDNLIAEVAAFVEENIGQISDIAFEVLYIRKAPATEGDGYLVKVNLQRHAGARISLEKKGIIIAEDTNNLELNSPGSYKFDAGGVHARNFNAYEVFVPANIIEADLGKYIRPYYINGKTKRPEYADNFVTIADAIESGKSKYGGHNINTAPIVNNPNN